MIVSVHVFFVKPPQKITGVGRGYALGGHNLIEMCPFFVSIVALVM